MPALSLSSHLLGACVLVLVGAVLMVIGLRALWRYAPKHWRTTAAVVLSSSAIYPERRGRAVLYVPSVRYRYQVNGADHEGDRYAYSSAEDMGQLEAVQRVLQQYPVGAAITVGYLASNPGVSCIKFDSRYSRSQMWALVCGGVLVMGVGALVMAGEFG